MNCYLFKKLCFVCSHVGCLLYLHVCIYLQLLMFFLPLVNFFDLLGSFPQQCSVCCLSHQVHLAYFTCARPQNYVTQRSVSSVTFFLLLLLISPLFAKMCCGTSPKVLFTPLFHRPTCNQCGPSAWEHQGPRVRFDHSVVAPKGHMH